MSSITTYPTTYVCVEGSRLMNRGKIFPITSRQIEHIASQNKLEDPYRKITELFLWLAGYSQQGVKNLFPNDKGRFLIGDRSLTIELQGRLQRLQEIIEGLRQGKENLIIQQSTHVNAWWLKHPDEHREALLAGEVAQSYEFLEFPFLDTLLWKRKDCQRIALVEKQQLETIVLLYELMNPSSDVGRELAIEFGGHERRAKVNALLSRTALYWDGSPVTWYTLLFLWKDRGPFNRAKVDALFTSLPLLPLVRQNKGELVDPVAIQNPNLSFTRYVALFTVAALEQFLGINLPSVSTEGLEVCKEKFAESFEASEKFRREVVFFIRESKFLLNTPTPPKAVEFLKSLRIHHYMRLRWKLSSDSVTLPNEERREAGGVSGSLREGSRQRSVSLFQSRELSNRQSVQPAAATFSERKIRVHQTAALVSISSSKAAGRQKRGTSLASVRELPGESFKQELAEGQPAASVLLGRALVRQTSAPAPSSSSKVVGRQRSVSLLEPERSLNRRLVVPEVRESSLDSEGVQTVQRQLGRIIFTRRIRSELFHMVMVRDTLYDGEIDAFFPLKDPPDANEWPQRRRFLRVMEIYQNLKLRYSIAKKDRFFVLVHLLEDSSFADVVVSSHSSNPSWNVNKCLAAIFLSDWERTLGTKFPDSFRDELVKKMKKKEFRDELASLPKGPAFEATLVDLSRTQYLVHPSRASYFFFRTFELFAQLKQKIGSRLTPELSAKLIKVVCDRDTEHEISFRWPENLVERFSEASTLFSRVTKGSAVQPQDQFALFLEFIKSPNPSQTVAFFNKFEDWEEGSLGGKELLALFKQARSYSIAHLDQFFTIFSDRLDRSKFRKVGKAFFSVFLNPSYFNATWRKENLEEFLALVNYEQLKEIDGEQFFPVLRCFLDKTLVKEHFIVLEKYQAYMEMEFVQPLYEILEPPFLSIAAQQVQSGATLKRHFSDLSGLVCRYNFSKKQRVRLLLSWLGTANPLNKTRFPLLGPVVKFIDALEEYFGCPLESEWVYPFFNCLPDTARWNMALKQISRIERDMMEGSDGFFAFPPSLVRLWEDEMPAFSSSAQLSVFDDSSKIPDEVFQSLSKVTSRLRPTMFFPKKPITDCLLIKEIGNEGVAYWGKSFDPRGVLNEVIPGVFMVVDWGVPSQKFSLAPHLAVCFFNTNTMKGSWTFTPFELVSKEQQESYFSLLQKLAEIVLSENSQRELKGRVNVEKTLESYPEADGILRSIANLGRKIGDNQLLRKMLLVLRSIKLDVRKALWIAAGKKHSLNSSKEKLDAALCLQRRVATPLVDRDLLNRESKGGRKLEAVEDNNFVALVPPQYVDTRASAKFFSTEEITIRLLEETLQFILTGSEGKKSLTKLNLTLDGSSLCNDFMLFVELRKPVVGREKTHRVVELFLESPRPDGEVFLSFRIEYPVKLLITEGGFGSLFHMHTVMIKSKFYFLQEEVDLSLLLSNEKTSTGALK